MSLEIKKRAPRSQFGSRDNLNRDIKSSNIRLETGNLFHIQQSNESKIDDPFFIMDPDKKLL